MLKLNMYSTPNFNTMKLLFLLLFISPIVTFGQDAIIHFEIKNATGNNIELSLMGDYANLNVLFGETYIYVPIENGKTDWTYQLSHPARIELFYNSENLEHEYSYSLFLSPGDEFNFIIDEQKIAQAPKIMGKGSQNNQPLIHENHQNIQSKLAQSYQQDSIPENVINALNRENEKNRNVLEAYISQFQPSKAFIDFENFYIDYFTLTNFFYFNETRKFYLREAYYRNEQSWKQIQDSLFLVHSINKPEYLNYSGYANLLTNFVNRTKEKVWKNPELELIYLATDEDKNQYNLDRENILKEKIIDRHFSGQTAEFLYADLFTHHNNFKEENLPEIFERFKQRYPNSIYIPYIEPRISKILELRKNELSYNTVLISNIDSIQTFDEVLKLVKGKTVLLDMWGTWCVACRRDFANHTEDIKEYFKNKPLDYLYIANHDESNEKKWRELIPYYKLTGTHILASSKLSKDIMSKVNGSGYPTNIIIKKDGTFELCDFSNGLQLETLFEQIDQVLNEE